MGTVVDKLNKILSIKETIKQAIISKGVSISDTDTFASYADKIEAIITGSGNYTGEVKLYADLVISPKYVDVDATTFINVIPDLNF